MMRRTLVLLLLIQASQLYAQERRALVIGIDQYELPANVTADAGGGRGASDFVNLNGCRNDAEAMRSLLVNRYQFPEKNVIELYDRDASRKRIVDALQELIAKASKDDNIVIYYAGHGSQMRNSLSFEADKLDETIVPSNTWEKDVADITDKELGKIYNAILDKGARLTVVLDCCHSGSMSRGPVFDAPSYRYLSDNRLDALDASKPEAPEKRPGDRFLILSASQDNELSQEQRDDDNNWHGAFTSALLQAINQQSIDAPVMHIFYSARAILRSNGKRQEPEIRGGQSRQRETLFGLNKGVLPDKTIVPVITADTRRINFQGGYAQGIRKGAELFYVVKGAGTNAADTVIVRIDSVMTVNRSYGTVIKGDAAMVKAGQAFELGNWVSSGAPLLKLYIPGSKFTPAQVNELVTLNGSLQQAGKVKWMNDLGKRDPQVTIFYKGDKCYANQGGKKIEELKATPDMVNKIAAGKLLFFNLPAAAELGTAIREQFATNRNIQLVDDPRQANYILFGTIDKKKHAAYGLMRSELSVDDSLGSMPLSTTAFPVIANNKEGYQDVADSLYEYAMRLGKIRGWLNLSGPAEGNTFAMKLVFMDNATKKPLDPPVAKIGKEISYHIMADPEIRKMKVVRKFAYVFMINRDGDMQLLYPDPEDGGNEAKLPRIYDGKPEEDLVIAEGTVGEPSGTDTYFLLTSDEPIQNYATLFNQQGVAGVDTRGAKNELSELLNMGNKNSTRGGPLRTAAKWSLQRISMKTHY